MKILTTLLAATFLVFIASASPPAPADAPRIVAQGGTTAQTDMASITVTPLTRQAGAKADWQTIYDYAGGVLPPGTRIKTEGKWIDPPVRQDQKGVTFGFPK